MRIAAFGSGTSIQFALIVIVSFVSCIDQQVKQV